jgi:hypothetical protein
VLLAASFSLRQVARGQDPVQPAKPGVASRETQGDNVREITAPPGNNSPPNLSISFIDSPSVACYQPDPAQNACYINWYYMSVNANPNYMIAMTVTLNTIGIVARTHGFFQTSMYTPYNMFGNGFKVECGALGSGGHGQMGKAYAWTITAKDSSNLGSANYGSVYCPAYIP